MMKTLSSIKCASLVVLASLALSGCAPELFFSNVENYDHPDGVYRGAFIDEGVIQVNVQFELVDGVVQSASFRHLVGAIPEYNMDTDEEPYRSVAGQYQEALDYLIGKPLSIYLRDLYEPGRIVRSEVDGYTGATIRANKILSAIRDALNRGPYQLPK